MKRLAYPGITWTARLSLIGGLLVSLYPLVQTSRYVGGCCYYFHQLPSAQSTIDIMELQITHFGSPPPAFGDYRRSIKRDLVDKAAAILFNFHDET